jgi:16S rRNA processing protein RimM
LVLGKITRTRGLKGLLCVRSFAESLESFKRYVRIILRFPDSSIRTYETEYVFQQRTSFAIKIKGIDHIDKAADLVGADICIRTEDLENTAADEYYWFQLLGMSVVDEKERFLGTLSEIYSTSAHDVYAVRKEGKEILLPAIEEVVLKVDLGRKIMVVRDHEVA